MARIQLPADFGWLPNSRWQLRCSGATWCVSLFFFFTAQLGHFFGSFTTVPVPSGGYVKNRESPGQIDRGGRYVLVILLLPATVNFPDNIDLCMHNFFDVWAIHVCFVHAFAGTDPIKPFLLAFCTHSFVNTAATFVNTAACEHSMQKWIWRRQLRGRLSFTLRAKASMGPNRITFSFTAMRSSYKTTLFLHRKA